MPQTRDIALEQLTAAGNALPIAGTRIDAAHSLGDALASGPPLAEMPVAEAIVDLVCVEGAVQLQAQADQLAAHLRQRQQEIDRRDALLNARLADFEKEVRDARLWLAERDEALNEREARLEASERAINNAQGTAPKAASDPITGGAAASVGQPSRPPITADGLAGGPMADFPGNPSEPRHPPSSANAANVGDQTDAAQSISQKWTNDDLNRRQAELEKFRENVSQMHRELLQLRLSADEAQAELRASLGEERSDEAVALGLQRLARHFHDEEAALTRRRNELEWLLSEQSSGRTT